MPTKNLRIEHLQSSYGIAKILRRGFALLRMTRMGDCGYDNGQLWYPLCG